MFRREILATGGLLLGSGCLADSYVDWQADAEFIITNERDNELEVSVRLKDGESAFAIEAFLLESGEMEKFEQSVPEIPPLSVVAKIINPVEETYEQNIRVGAPKYTVQIQSNSIETTSGEN
jgi:hypothetical protein